MRHRRFNRFFVSSDAGFFLIVGLFQNWANWCSVLRHPMRSITRLGLNAIPAVGKKIGYFTFAIFTMLPLACASFGSFTTVTYNSFSPSLNATFVLRLSN
jgi:hypothetical protein